jgi:arabinosyltransferase A
VPRVSRDSSRRAALGTRPSGSAAIARLVAVLAGLAGIILCSLTPLLPVNQTTATIVWPQAPGPGGTVGDITAPLVSGAPEALEVSIPCTAIATLPPSGGVAFSTNPAEGIDAARNGLFVRANAESVLVAFRDTVAAVAPRATVASGTCSTINVWANPGGVGAEFVGIPGAAGTLPPDKE